MGVMLLMTFHTAQADTCTPKEAFDIGSEYGKLLESYNGLKEGPLYPLKTGINKMIHTNEANVLCNTMNNLRLTDFNATVKLVFKNMRKFADKYATPELREKLNRELDSIILSNKLYFDKEEYKSALPEINSMRRSCMQFWTITPAKIQSVIQEFTTKAVLEYGTTSLVNSLPIYTMRDIANQKIENCL